MAYKDTFPKKHTFLAVVHVENFDQAERNVQIAIENGADGVFLINHKSSAGNLLATYEVIRQRLGDDMWVGLNFLDLHMRDALGCKPGSCPGLWTDDNGISEDMTIPDVFAEEFNDSRKYMNWGGLWFGGTAFKYQPEVKDLARVVNLAMRYTDVITTSGDKTGNPPSIEKLQIMREAAGDHTIANASGTTPENVYLMKPFVDCFLVASSILQPGSFTEFDPVRVRAMADAINA